jgi:high-affinity iron transporter
MFLGSVILLAQIAGASPQAPADPAPIIQRLGSITALAAQEYGIGVAGGAVVAPEEVQEAKLFLAEARRSAGHLPDADAKVAVAGIDSLLQLIARTAPADSLAARARLLVQSLATRFNVSLDITPTRAPSLALGARVYQAQCASCHGATGAGDGPAGKGLVPAPSNLTDARLLADATLLDFYRRVTIGVAGTTMPSFEDHLTAEQRWAVAAYAGTLRLPAAMRNGADPAGDLAPVFASVRRQLDSGLALAAAGNGEAGGTAIFDAYMTFEQAEREVRARNAGLATRLEAGFAGLRTRAVTGAAGVELVSLHRALLAELEKAERETSDRLSPLSLFTQSVVLLVREGLEAILVVGAVLAFLAKTGASHRRREIHLGVAAALGASLITAFLLESIFRASRVSQEGLEGGIMLLAAAMLFYVSYWLLSKMEVAKWNRFVRGQVQGALSSGSSLALVSVAFLAVYREGFETVLFYKALLLSGPGTLAPVLAGMAVGGMVLGAAYYAINRFGVRLPLKPFFGVTSAFLYYMAFVFAGKGIAELQEGGVVGTTIVGWAPRLPAMGIYPTVESLLAQGFLLAALIAGLVWTFVIEPRRLPVTSVLVPDTAGPAAIKLAPKAPVEPALARLDRRENDMLRSLERMDADLAELRAEVERLKDLVRKSSPRT